METGPDDAPLRPFAWRGYVLALCAGGLGIFLTALPLDAALRALGFDLHPIIEPALSGIFGPLFGFPFGLLLWRLGLSTLTQYVIGGFGVLIPCTILSVLLAHPAHDMLLASPGETQGEDWAVTAYVRIGRAVVLMPAFILGFWWMFHRYLRMAPRMRRAS